MDEHCVPLCEPCGLGWNGNAVVLGDGPLIYVDSAQQPPQVLRLMSPPPTLAEQHSLPQTSHHWNIHGHLLLDSGRPPRPEQAPESGQTLEDTQLQKTTTRHSESLGRMGVDVLEGQLSLLVEQ